MSNRLGIRMESNSKSRSDAGWITVGLLACFLLSLLYGSFVAAQIWNWVMPALFGLPVLGLGQMLALRVVSAAFRGPGEIPREPDPTPFRTAFTKALMWTVLLGLGALASNFV